MTARRMFLALAVVCLAAFFLGRDVRGPSARISADGWYYHCYLVSLIGDGDLDFTDEYAVTGNWYRFGRTTAGVPANPFGIGPAVFELPFYLAGAAVARLAGEDTGGFGVVQGRVTMLAAPLFSLGALIFAYRLLRRRLLSERSAALCGFAIWASGPILYYAIRQPGYAHPFATFFTSWLLDAWDRSRDRPRTLATWLGLGALLGATALARPQLALWGVVLLGPAIEDLRRPHHLLAGAAAALAVFAPQLLAWKAVYGAWWVLPQGAGFMVWEAPRWAEVLFASRGGLFAWAPLWAVAAVGLIGALPRTGRLAAFLLLGFALQVWANGAVWDWWAGGSFGGRRFDSCLVPMAVGLGWLFARRRPVAWVIYGITAICVVANIWLAIVSNVFTLPAHLGAPVAEQLRSRIPPGLSHAAGGLSWLVTSPARFAWALAHGVEIGAYDRVVGVNVTTEQFPGTGGAPKPVQKMKLTGREPWISGAVPDARGARLPEGKARLLIALNRRHGPVLVGLKASVPLELSWDGHPVPDGRTLDPVERGVHDLDVVAAPGTILEEFSLEVPPSTPP